MCWFSRGKSSEKSGFLPDLRHGESHGEDSTRQKWIADVRERASACFITIGQKISRTHTNARDRYYVDISKVIFPWSVIPLFETSVGRIFLRRCCFFLFFFFFFFFLKTFPFRSFPTRLSLWTRAPRLEDSLRATNNVKRRLQHPGVSRAVPNHSWNYVILLVGETSPAPAPGQGIFSCVLCKRVSVAFRCQGSRGEQRYPRKYRHACTYFVAVHSEPVLLCLNDSRFSSNKHRCEMIFASGPRERLSYDTVRGQCS